MEKKKILEIELPQHYQNNNTTIDNIQLPI